MRYFKDSTNKLHAIDDGFENLLPQGCTEISFNEFNALTAPSPDDVAAMQAIASRIAADENDVNSAKLNPVIQYLVTHTPAECNAKARGDVTDLASAKIMFGHFAEALCVLAKDKLRD
jgi:hypothetical protein